MLVNINKFLYFLLVFAGFYLFTVEFQNLNKIDQSIERKKILVNKTIEIDETSENKIINLKKNNINQSKLNKIEVVISKGDTFLSILNDFNFEEKLIFKIINKIEEYFDLRKLKVNNKIFFF